MANAVWGSLYLAAGGFFERHAWDWEHVGVSYEWGGCVDDVYYQRSAWWIGLAAWEYVFVGVGDCIQVPLLVKLLRRRDSDVLWFTLVTVRVMAVNQAALLGNVAVGVNCEGRDRDCVVRRFASFFFAGWMASGRTCDLDAYQLIAVRYHLGPCPCLLLIKDARVGCQGNASLFNGAGVLRVYRAQEACGRLLWVILCLVGQYRSTAMEFA